MEIRKLQDFADQYQKGDPFPHFVIDNLFDQSVLLELAKSFPLPGSHWWEYNNELEKKFACNDLKLMPENLANFLNFLNSNLFIEQIEKLTGIPGLIADHTLNGGGLHQICQGGKLDIHCDYNYHPITKLDRRVNVLIYLNTAWCVDWGGYLELWSKDMTQKVVSIAPLFNRMVVFSTTDTAFHGHPEPLRCPPQLTRKSIAMYYYTHGRPDSEKTSPHSTLFQRRPQDPITLELEQLRQRRGISRI